MSIVDKRATGRYIIGVKASIVGSTVMNVDKQDLGTIEDVMIDTRTNTVAYAILSFGGFLGLGDKKFAIPWRAVDFHALDGVAILNLDKERLKNAPGFKLGEWPDMGDMEWAYRLTDGEDAEEDSTSY